MKGDGCCCGSVIAKEWGAAVEEREAVCGVAYNIAFKVGDGVDGCGEESELWDVAGKRMREEVWVCEVASERA